MASNFSCAKQQLKLYQTAYWGDGPQDKYHWKVFQELRARMDRDGASSTPQSHPTTWRVLYPGSHRHLTPLLFWEDVTFCDCDAKVGGLYASVKQDPTAQVVLDYLQEHSAARPHHEENNIPPTSYRFLCADITKPLSKENAKLLLGDIIDPSDPRALAQSDLLISLNAGCLAASCTKYIRSGGFLLVNDSHSDARNIFVNHAEDWTLEAYWDDDASLFATERLEDCFRTMESAKGSKGKKSKDQENDHPSNKKAQTMVPLTPAQVEESIRVGAVRKHSFRMVFDHPSFFLFRKK